MDADLKDYFDSIPHDQLLACVREHVADGRLLAVLEKFLQAGVMKSGGEWSAAQDGTPQGAVLSPLLANLYLNELDHLMAASGCEMTRYADDFVVQCDSETEARRALGLIQEWSARRGLKLHPQKTRITDAGQTGGGFDFLGYHLVKHQGKWKRWPREKSAKAMRRAIKQATPRASGESLGATIARLNAKLKSWFEYFKHSNAASLGAMDRYIRGRLRSILRKRAGRKGRALGKDHQRWPKAKFETLGLFCLEAARVQLSQPR